MGFLSCEKRACWEVLADKCLLMWEACQGSFSVLPSAASQIGCSPPLLPVMCFVMCERVLLPFLSILHGSQGDIDIAQIVAPSLRPV